MSAKKPLASTTKSTASPRVPAGGAPKPTARMSPLPLGAAGGAAGAGLVSPRTPGGAGVKASPRVNTASPGLSAPNGGASASPSAAAGGSGAMSGRSPRAGPKLAIGGAGSNNTSPNSSPRLSTTASPGAAAAKHTFKQQRDKDAKLAGVSSPPAAVAAPAGPPKSVLIVATYAFPFHKWVYADHTKVLFTSANNRPFLDATIRKAYAHIEYFDQFDTNGLVEYQALALHRTFKFTHVVCQAEQDILRCARLRAALLFGGGAPTTGPVHAGGQSLNSALSFRDKMVMKDRVRTKCAVPNYRKVDSASDLIQFISQYGFPVVVKPTRGMGSVRTVALRDTKQLEAFLAPGLSLAAAASGVGAGNGGLAVDGPVDWMVETFVSGQMYHVDGCVHNGQVVIMWPSCYLNDCMDYNSNSNSHSNSNGSSNKPPARFLASYSLAATNPLVPRLRQCMTDALSTLDCPKSFAFHGEAWHTADDKLVFCEIACRAGGAGVVPTILELFKVDLNKFSVQTQCADKPTSPLDDCKNAVPAANAGWMLMYPRVGRLVSLPAACELKGVLSYTVSAAPGTEFKAIAHCTVEIASFVVTAKTEKDMVATLNAAAEWFEKNTKWA